MISSSSTPPHFLKPLVGGEHRGGPFVAGVDQLEEEHEADPTDRHVAGLGQERKGGMGEQPEPARQVARGLRLGQRLDQGRQRAGSRPCDRTRRLRSPD